MGTIHLLRKINKNESDNDFLTWLFQVRVAGGTNRGQDTLLSHPPSLRLGQFIHVNSPHVCNLGMWERTGVPGENPPTQTRGELANSTQIVALLWIFFSSSTLQQNDKETLFQNLLYCFRVFLRLYQFYQLGLLKNWCRDRAISFSNIFFNTWDYLLITFSK